MVEFNPIFLLKGGNADAAILFPARTRILAHRQRGDVSRRKRVVALYDELRPSIFGYLCSIGIHPEQAEDVIQETFLRLFRDFTDELVADGVRPWVFRVAQYVIADEHRKSKRLLDLDAHAERVIDLRVDPSLNPEESLARKEQANRLFAAVTHLPEQQRQCLHLRAEGLRYREIATALGVSIPRVAVLLEKALARLARET